MLNVRIERDHNHRLIMGRMIGTTWHYTVVPEGVSKMKIVFETWFGQMMAEKQPGTTYSLDYQEGIIGSPGWEL